MSSGRKQYPFHLIEPKWQRHWDEQGTFRAWNPGEPIPAEHPFARRHPEAARSGKLPPKFYILDMFPYPSGAGLHVGHPEGYTATDILARYRRAQGYHTIGSNIPPLGLQVLTRLTPPAHTVEIIDEVFGVDRTEGLLKQGGYDLVGKTAAYSARHSRWNFRSAKRPAC